MLRIVGYYSMKISILNFQKHKGLLRQLGLMKASSFLNFLFLYCFFHCIFLLTLSIKFTWLLPSGIQPYCFSFIFFCWILWLNLYARLWSCRLLEAVLGFTGHCPLDVYVWLVSVILICWDELRLSGVFCCWTVFKLFEKLSNFRIIPLSDLESVVLLKGVYSFLFQTLVLAAFSSALQYNVRHSSVSQYLFWIVRYVIKVYKSNLCIGFFSFKKHLLNIQTQSTWVYT